MPGPKATTFTSSLQGVSPEYHQAPLAKPRRSPSVRAVEPRPLLDRATRNQRAVQREGGGLLQPTGATACGYLFRGSRGFAPLRCVSFSYDFPALVEADFALDPREHRRRIDIRFFHEAEQRETMAQLVRQYGTSTTGLGRILLRAHVKKLFRKIEVDGVATDRGFEQSYRRSSNLYGD